MKKFIIGAFLIGMAVAMSGCKMFCDDCSDCTDCSDCCVPAK